MLGRIGPHLAAGAVLLIAATAAAIEPSSSQAAAAGRRLFTGEQRLAAGGPPCGACHAIGGQGAAFAGSLGPDLARSFDAMPREAVDGLLQDLPFPTMAPDYAGHALTAQERAQLSAFFLDSADKPPPGGGPVIAAAALLAALALLALGVAARRGRGSARERLMATARRGQGGTR